MDPPPLVVGWKLIVVGCVSSMRIFITTVVAIVSAAIIGGFFLIDSPKETRFTLLDDKRIETLRTIQNGIMNFMGSKKRLPATLEEVDKEVKTGGVSFVSFAAEDGLIYKKKDDKEFLLCANFYRESRDGRENIPSPFKERIAPLFPPPAESSDKAFYFTDENWSHNAGFTCFSRFVRASSE